MSDALARMAARSAAVLPQSWRFRILVVCARALAPVFERADLGRWHRTQRTSSVHDTALFAACDLLDRRRIRYDPELHVVGHESLRDALAKGRGLVLLSVHGILSNLLIRYCVRERGLTPTMVAADGVTSFVSGAGQLAEAIRPAPDFLLRLRTRLRNNQVVCVMVDRAPGAPRALEFPSQYGPPITITDFMLRLALRLKAPVLFMTCHLEDTRVVLRMAEIAGADLAALTAALVGEIEADRGRVVQSGS